MGKAIPNGRLNTRTGKNLPAENDFGNAPHGFRKTSTSTAADYGLTTK